MAIKTENERKSKIFAAEFIANGGNATKAAIKAGSKPSNAKQAGWRLLKKPTVIALISKQVEKALITADEVIGELKTVGMGDYFEYKSDKIKSLELLGKHLKLFTDKTELTGADGKPLETTSTIIIQGVKSDGK